MKNFPKCFNVLKLKISWAMKGFFILKTFLVNSGSFTLTFLTTKWKIYVDIQLTLVAELISDRPKTAKFLPEVVDFAQTLSFYSPKAYDFLRLTFNLPSPSTLWRQLSSVNCLPGNRLFFIVNDCCGIIWWISYS